MKLRTGINLSVHKLNYLLHNLHEFHSVNYPFMFIIVKKIYATQCMIYLTMLSLI
jgi:hypothetical protein